MSNEPKNKITGYCVPIRLIYPKVPIEEFAPGSWGLLEVDVGQILQGSFPAGFSKNGWFPTVVFKGALPPIDTEKTYYFEVEMVADSKSAYGVGFNILFMTQRVRLTKFEEQKLFLESILTEHQIDILYEELIDPFEAIDSGDIFLLSTVKGIGEKTAEKIIETYNRTKKDANAFLVLREEFGLTDAAVTKLQQRYLSTDTIIAKLRENPYELMALDGYGFKKCDALALKGGMAKDAKFRVRAYVTHFLTEQAEMEGNSWIYLRDLLHGVVEFVPSIKKEIFAEWLREWTGRVESDEPEFLYYDEEQKRIGLKHYRGLEESITEEIFRLLDAPKKNLSKCRYTIEDAIRDCEADNGWEYTDEQKAAIRGFLTNNVEIITARAGCVDRDTEFFNGEKWKPICEYTEGESVLQYNKDGTANLVKPNGYIKLPCDNLWLTQTKYGIDMCLSDEHRVIYQNSRGNIAEHTMMDFKKIHENLVSGFGGKMFTSFAYDGKGINLSDSEIKIMCAVVCDGSFYRYENSKRCRFHIKKERKKDRLRELFNEAAINYIEKKSAAEGYTDFYITAPIRTKVFTKEWYQCTQHQFQIICDNILFWDGCVTNGRSRFSTNVKENADFVQFAFSACGYKATVDCKDRVGNEYFTCGKLYIRKTKEYEMSITKRNMVSIGGFHRDNPNKTKILPYKPTDGLKYCFTVPSSMWVMRRNGKILITGNSGKTASVGPIARFCEANGLIIAQTALSGRAASNLSEVTKIEGKTIHRLLGYSPRGGFSYDKDNQIIENVVIVDELSMNDNELLYRLLQAIPNGSKVIMLGDHSQLEPLSNGNFLKDCLDTNVVPCYRLTKIHRQAQKSAIITESIKVSNGQQIISNSEISEIRGELKDLKIVTYKDADLSRMKFLTEYRTLLRSGVSANDIIGVVPMKLRGAMSSFALNNDVQKFVNPDEHLPSIKLAADKDKYYTIRLGDRVINRKNHYDTITRAIYERYGFDKDNPVEPIYNGNLGFVTDIQEDYIVVDFKQQGEIVIPKAYWEYVFLGYVVTTHSFQGSQSPYVVVGLDMSAYMLLSREMLYTALTRSKKYCVLVGQINAVKKATSISRVSVKQTWLKELLLKKEVAKNET